MQLREFVSIFFYLKQLITNLSVVTHESLCKDCFSGIKRMSNTKHDKGLKCLRYYRKE